MRNRWLGLGAEGTRRAMGLAFLVAIGCSPAEELKPDPGVSPFYPGPAADAKAPAGPLLGGPVADRAAADAPVPEGPIRPQDVEKTLRIALRAGERGDLPRAASLLDRILAVEPVNREALFGRAALALTQAQKDGPPAERLAAIEEADAVAKKLRNAYDRPNAKEIELYSRVAFELIRANVGQDRLDRAVAVLKDVHEMGYDPFMAIEQDKGLAKLRAFKGYQDLVKSIDAERIARVKDRVKEEFARTPAFPFDFHVKDLDGKSIAQEQYRGKVLVVDIWGTWCKPCRDTIPGLIRLYEKHRGRGLEILGLDFEQDNTDPEKTRQLVKQYIKDAGIPYPIAVFDDATRDKIPNLQGFPTTIILDRTGKVRLDLTGGGPDAVAVIDAAVEVLLAEPEARPKTPASPPAETEGRPK